MLRNAEFKQPDCRLSQEGQEASFPIDRITPSARGNATEPAHLTLVTSLGRRPEIEAMRGRKRSTRRLAEPLSLRKTLRTFSTIPQFLQTRSPAMNFIGV